MKSLVVMAAGAAEWIAGLALAGVLGAYGSLIMLYNKINDHAANARHHPDGDRLVYADVCAERVKRLEAGIADVAQEIKSQGTQYAKEFEEIKKLIRNGHRPADS